MAGRPEVPSSGIVNLNLLINSYFKKYGIPCEPERISIDIVLTPYQSFLEKHAKNLVFLLDGKIYRSQRSQFVEALETTVNGVKFYIYDNFKHHSRSHLDSYKHKEMFIVPYGDTLLYLPYQWRIN